MIDRRLILAAALLLAACDRAADERNAATPAPPPADAPQSAPAARPVPLPLPDPVFTSLARADCTLLEERREEAGYARYACSGRGGYRLELVEGDGREDLVLIPREGPRRPLQLPATIAKGAFSGLGETAEWIGPDRLIVRYEVFEAPEGRPPQSYLLVVDLAAACVIAKVPPGAGQNERARAIAGADPQPGCVTG